MADVLRQNQRLLFISNLFPDDTEPVRGLDNATLLHEMLGEWEIRALVPRPVRIGSRFQACSPREIDHRTLGPTYVPCPYLPRIGDAVNDRLMARALSTPLERLIDEFQPRALLCSWLFPDGVAVARLASRHQLPLVLVTQGTDTHHYLKVPLRRRRILEAVEVSHTTICRSADLARRLREAGADPDKLSVVYNGVDTALFRVRPRNEARLELDFPPEPPLLLFVGNFLPVKDPAFLLRVHHQLNQRRHARQLPPARLVMIGDGPLRSEIENLADQLGSRPHIEMPGRMPSADIGRWMNAADVLCLTSVNEGFPNVILEAMACELPVVSTDVGGIHEKIDSGRNGWLISRGDLTTFVDRLELSLEAPPDGYTPTSTELSWQATASRYSEVLNSAVL